jgi:hypothetical protein
MVWPIMSGAEDEQRAYGKNEDGGSQQKAPGLVPSQLCTCVTWTVRVPEMVEKENLWQPDL